MIAAQLALKFAIAQVEAAVRRVEGKVEAVLQLALAARAGGVIGNNDTVSSMVTYLERHGRLTDADWNAVAGVRPAVESTVKQLRNHVTLTLNSFDPNAPIQERSHTVGRAVNELGETLALLIVAEDSLYKWQRLRIARVEAAEPEHLKHVIEDARELLVDQLKEDAALYRKTKETLEKMKKTEAIDGIRYESVRNLQQDTEKLREHLEQFAQARGLQVSEWTEFENRSFDDAVGAALDIATEKASRVLAATGQRIAQVSSAAKPALDIVTEKAGQVLAATGERIAQVGNAAKPVLDIATEKAGRVLAATGEGLSMAGSLFPRGQSQNEASAKDEPVKQNGQTE
jgi:hypothetical protein